MHRVVAEINKKNIVSNLNSIRNIIDKKDIVMAVVKANAYGLGMKQISMLLNENGVNFFAVSSIGEGVNLREISKEIYILNLSKTFNEDLGVAVNNNIVLTIYDEHSAQELIDFVTKNRIKNTIHVHIIIDTGMRRFGFCSISELCDVVRMLNSNSKIEVDGLYSHFSSADTDDSYTILQIQRFKNALDKINENGLNFKYIHIANSAGAVKFKQYLEFTNMYRIGAFLYGLNSTGIDRDILPISSVLSVKTKIIAIKQIKKNQKVGYNGSIIAKSNMRIAVASVGFYDLNFGSNRKKIKVLLNNIYVDIIGTICMDHVFLNVTNLDNVNVGDDVIIIGSSKGNEITIEDFSSMTNVLDINICTSLGNRVTKKYY